MIAVSHAFVINRWSAAAIAAGAILVGLCLAHVVLISRDGMQPTKAPMTSKRLVAERRRGIKSLIIGADGRASTSKVQAVLWTFAVLFAFSFLLVWGRSAGCNGTLADGPRCRDANTARAAFDNAVRNPLQPEYFVLLGFPLTAALAAKALTTNKVITGTLTKDDIQPTPPPTPAPAPAPAGNENGDGPGGSPQPPGQPKGVVQSLSEVIGNDQGQVDLLDFQYALFNLLTLAFFLITFLTRPEGGLPNLPPTLLALSGVAAAAYTTKKALETDVQAVITAVTPDPCPRTTGTTLRIRGSGFGERATTGGDKADVQLHGQSLTITAWRDSSITATLTDDAVAALTGQTTVQLIVVDADGTQSQATTVDLQ